MNFLELASQRQSCRAYLDKEVEQEKIQSLIKAAHLAPSACNSQPFEMTVCTKENAKKVEELCVAGGMNKFATQAPVCIVLSEGEYSRSAALGAKRYHNDYRSLDIGEVCAYITLQATSIGLSTCILGAFKNEAIKEICHIDGDVRLVILVGYASDETVRNKIRKDHYKII